MWHSFMTNKTVLLVAFISGALSACANQPQQTGTLEDLDKPTISSEKSEIAARNKEQIKRAYYEYIEDAPDHDKLRIGAVTRIAELELELDDQLKADKTPISDLDDPEYDRRVRSTIALLTDTLTKFPNALGNDHLLYQLAKAHDQLGETDEAIAALEQLVNRYSTTVYFVESKFRIAENAFVKSHYLDAEIAYTDVIDAHNPGIFGERALFKRGWARFKQELYEDALDDFYAAARRYGFRPNQKLEKSDQELFGEYFRAIGLAFIYLGGESALESYFARNPSNDFIFESYKTVAQLYLTQNQYSDAAATYAGFVKNNPYHAQVVEADLAVVRIWKDAKFSDQYRQAFASFYSRYEPNSAFWRDSRTKADENAKKLATAAIRENIVLLAAYEHSRYRQNKRNEHLESAKIWYERYLKDYSSYARQDKIYQLYAELLGQSGAKREALRYHELAAFDGNIILDKESAYAAVFLTDQQQREADASASRALLDKHLQYAELYAQLYPTDKQAATIVQNAVQLAFKKGLREQVIALANILPDSAPGPVREEVNILKGQAYFDLKNYEDAESVYRDLLVSPSLPAKSRQDLENKLALSIYRQAEAAKNAQQPDLATQRFLRIAKETPKSELAPVAVYDAIAIFMDTAQWEQAIQYLNIFKRDYPNHILQSEVTKKLSVAYLNADRGLDAAREFEKLSDFNTNESEKMAALWQAAELYRQKSDYSSAIRAYRDYAHAYKQPYAQNMEAMGHLAVLYGKIADQERRQFWLRAIVTADAKAPKSEKTERTQYLAANAAFDLAELRRLDFDRVRLAHPLQKSLQDKKTAMQDAVKLYGQAATYGHSEFVTRSTLAIGDIYRAFSKALLESERPRNLTADELEQYNILLEDQAFPFEDKAIEFYETNVSRIAQGTYDQAVETSLRYLKDLFPARYGRPAKVETFVAQLDP